MHNVLQGLFIRKHALWLRSKHSSPMQPTQHRVGRPADTMGRVGMHVATVATLLVVFIVLLVAAAAAHEPQPQHQHGPAAFHAPSTAAGANTAPSSSSKRGLATTSKPTGGTHQTSSAEQIPLDDEGSSLDWAPGDTLIYQSDSKWWAASGSAAATTAAATERHAWSPPVAPENHGIRCNVAITPLRRERFPPVATGCGSSSSSNPTTNANSNVDNGDESADDVDGSGDESALGDAAEAVAAAAPNSWLVHITVTDCRQLRSRFHGRYVPMPRPRSSSSSRQHEGASTSDTLMEQITLQLHTPFYATRSDNGALRRLYFHANETLASRNFKRGAVGFLNFRHPPQGQQAYQAVDQDETGV